MPRAIAAAPIFYDFHGSCVSLEGNGCAAFGLMDGAPVAGTLSFDESFVAPNDRLILNPSSVPFEFSFVFGSFAVSEATIFSGFGSPLEVFFLPPSGQELNALSGPIPFKVLTDGSITMLLSPAKFVEVTQFFALSQNRAGAGGGWVERPTAAVPEPTSLFLTVLGPGGAIARRISRKRAG
jgi:hypothetical protein